MDAIQAEQMAKAWTEAWNTHDLDALMEHYAENVVFHSPFVKLLQVKGETTVCGKTALREYFRRGMEAYPHSRFQLHRTGVGVDSIVMNYISVNGMLANELHVLNEDGKAIEVRCHYSDSV
ncbi:MAG: nuclear transport factor 2 family protein [Fimbriimonadaceae bacterium]|nr:nuclear transport factor 2 family protein [Fimbriimonadaceae bacterium]